MKDGYYIVGHGPDRILYDPALRDGRHVHPTEAQRRQSEEHGKIIMREYEERVALQQWRERVKRQRNYNPYGPDAW
jgi:hypothetical protein